MDAVAAAAPIEDKLPQALLRTVEGLEGQDDDELWRLAQRAMPPEASERLENLHFKQRDKGLSREEDSERTELLYDYERTMLIRAQAAKLLKDRGHDISGILVGQ